MHTHNLFVSTLVLCLSSLFDIFHTSQEQLFLIKIQILLKTVTAYMYRYCTTYVTYIQQFEIIYLYRNYQDIPHGPRVCLRKNNTSSIKIVQMKKTCVQLIISAGVTGHLVRDFSQFLSLHYILVAACLPFLYSWYLSDEFCGRQLEVCPTLTLVKLNINKNHSFFRQVDTVTEDNIQIYEL